MPPTPTPTPQIDVDQLAWEAALCSTLETLPEVEAAITASTDARQLREEVDWLKAKWDYAVDRMGGNQDYPEAPPLTWREGIEVNLAILDVVHEVMFMPQGLSTAQAAVDQLRADLDALQKSQDVCSEAEREVWAEAPIPLPLPADLEFFTTVLAQDALGCWDGLHGRAADDSLGQCKITLESLLHQSGPDLIDHLLSTGAHHTRATCPAVWARTAATVLGLYDSVLHELLWPPDIDEEGLFDGVEDQTGSIAADRYNFLTGGEVGVEHCNDVHEMPDAIDMRVDLAADAAKFDRLVGGWFGRAGSASTDGFDVWSVLNDWSSWRGRLIWYDVVLDPSCHQGVEEALAAASSIERSMQVLHGHVRGWWGWDDDIQRDDHISDALDREIPGALLRFEACTS